MSIQLTREQAIEGLRRAVQDKGDDHVVDTCIYFATPYTGGTLRAGDPVCIVGHVLHYYGYGPDDLGSPTGYACGGKPNDTVVTSLTGFKDLDPETRSVLRRAQEQQDCGLPWGDVIDRILAEEEDVD